MEWRIVKSKPRKTKKKKKQNIEISRPQIASRTLTILREKKTVFLFGKQLLKQLPISIQYFFFRRQIFAFLRK